MAGLMRKIGRGMLFGPLELLLSRRQRIWLGRRILERANGDGLGDFRINGEFYVLGKVRQRLRGRPGVVFDVGANVGEWTIELARGMGAELTVHCFEPVGKTHEALLENLKAIAPASVMAHRMALGARPGEAEMFIAAEAGTNSLILREGAPMAIPQSARETIKIAAGDDFCAEQGINQIDFLKIDVEGFELEVLKGFSRMLGEKRIGCIQFEYGGTWIDARIFLRDAFEMLGRHGYAIGKIHPHGVESFERYAQTLETFVYANFLALRPDWAGVFDRIEPC